MGNIISKYTMISRRQGLALRGGIGGDLDGGRAQAPQPVDGSEGAIVTVHCMNRAHLNI